MCAGLRKTGSACLSVLESMVIKICMYRNKTEVRGMRFHLLLFLAGSPRHDSLFIHTDTSSGFLSDGNLRLYVYSRFCGLFSVSANQTVLFLSLPLPLMRAATNYFHCQLI